MEQKLIDYITANAARQLDIIDRNRSNDVEEKKQMVLQWRDVFLELSPLTDGMIEQLRVNTHYHVTDYVYAILNSHVARRQNLPYPWTETHPLIQKIIRSNYAQSNDSLSRAVNGYIARALTEDRDVDVLRFVDFLYKQKFTNEQIVSTVCAFSVNPFYYYFYPSDPRRGEVGRKENILSGFATFLIPLLPGKKGFLGLGKTEGLKKIIDDIIFGDRSFTGKKIYWLAFQLDHFPEGLIDYEPYLWNFDYNGIKSLNLPIVHYLVEYNAGVYEKIVIEALHVSTVHAEARYAIFSKLSDQLSGKYDHELEAIGEKHLAYFHAVVAKDHYYHDPYIGKLPLSQVYSEYLWRRDETKAINRITRFVHESTFLPPQYFDYLGKKMGDAAIPLHMEALFKDPEKIPSNAGEYYRVIFKILTKYTLEVKVLEKIVAFAVKVADKKSRVLAAEILCKYPEAMVPVATDLLTKKTVDQRVTGALILSLVPTEQAEKSLSEAVDKEINDDTRDIILEALAEKRFSSPYTRDEVNIMIAKADERKKLAKWNEKWLAEENVPKLYWKDLQTPLRPEEVRFLLYRMKRAQGLNSDSEAKQLINLLDAERSQAFAKAMLTAFQNSNADSKLKYYLTLAGLLGGDEMMHSLNALFKKSVVDKRVKMAEYVIGALAMVGTDKALRLVEVIYRKFATKKPALSKAAHDALAAAANELSITMDELADKIIPDFDFDGLYKKFIAGDGEEYRAFINAEFKLNYFTEDNKIRKSLPSSVSKEVKAEFKEIEKEVNDVIKSQSGRLEKYMLEERRWPADQWKDFFFSNPIMFVYALKLVWGVFDENGKLVDSFYCSEDTSLYTISDEELELNDRQYVGILHPVHLDKEGLNAWRDKLYKMSLVTIFPILDRPLFNVDESEREQSYSKTFFGKDVPKGADYVNTFLVKQNWIKSSGDGGRSEFTKVFMHGAIKAYANIDGPTAWYQGGTAEAKVFEINFMGKNWQEKIKLKDVPIIFYSEVMSDIDQLIKAS